MKKAPNPKVFLVLAVGALVIGGGASFWAFNGLNDVKASLAKLQTDTKDEKALKKELSEAQAKVQESSTQLQHLEQGVPDFAYVPTMLTELEQTGKAAGIDVVGVRPVPKQAAKKPQQDSPDGETPKRKAYEELDIEVKGRGSYRSVMNFVQALTKFPKVVAARTVELTPKQDPLKPGVTLDVTINLRAYVFAADKPKDRQVAMAPRNNHEG